MRHATAIDRRNAQAPKTVDYLDIDFDVFSDLLSFFVRSVNVIVSQDLDEAMQPHGLAGGTGKISTLLLADANPGIRPSVLAHFIRKDRSAMGKIIERMEADCLVKLDIAPDERRARALTVTRKGRALAAQVRAEARAQDERFFSVLSASERETLLNLLRKVYEGYVDMVPTAGDAPRAAKRAGH